MREIGTVGELTALQRDLMYLISDGEGIHKADVKRALQSSYGKSFRRTTVYDAIRELEEEGLVNIVDDSGRSQNVMLSLAGVSALEYHHLWQWSMLHG